MGGQIFTYLAGTTTPAATYTSSDGLTQQANPIVLNTNGLPANPIWLGAGISLKLVFKDANDVTLRTVDNVLGVNDPANVTAQDQWVTFSGSPTYVSATSFSVSGDQTGTFQVGRRLKSTNSGGIAYSTIDSATFSAGITTVVLTNDSTTLDSGLSLVSYGLLSTENPSLPNSDAARTTLGASSVGNAVFTATTTLAARDAIEAAPEIVPVAASVAGNALTVTVNPCTLNFRSTTATIGTTSAVTLGSAASVVVPSGATLGTTNATQARLAILAINNAGTIEAAVCYPTAVNLDESGVISTTAISAAADTASVVYSTTARTNVAYRVVGFVDITEATAGTWATAPTTVQGAGGQAFRSFGSLGFGQTINQLSASRTAGTTYTNTTGKPIFIAVSLTSTVTATATASINSLAMQGSTSTAGNNMFICAIVPPGGTYSVTANAGVPTVQSWMELR